MVGDVPLHADHLDPPDVYYSTFLVPVCFLRTIAFFYGRRLVGIIARGENPIPGTPSNTMPSFVLDVPTLGPEIKHTYSAILRLLEEDVATAAVLCGVERKLPLWVPRGRNVEDSWIPYLRR